VGQGVIRVACAPAQAEGGRRADGGAAGRPPARLARPLLLGRRVTRPPAPRPPCARPASPASVLGRGQALLELGGHSHWVWAARFCPAHDQLLASASTDCTVALWYAPGVAKLRDPPGAAVGGGGGGSSGTRGRCAEPGWAQEGGDRPRAHEPALPVLQHLCARPGACGPAPSAPRPHPPPPRPPPSLKRPTPPRGGDDGRAALLAEEHEDSVYGLAWSAADPWLLASLSYDGRVVVSAVPKGIKYKILI
jgi:WD40 repeat protein